MQSTQKYSAKLGVYLRKDTNLKCSWVFDLNSPGAFPHVGFKSASMFLAARTGGAMSIEGSENHREMLCWRFEHFVPKSSVGNGLDSDESVFAFESSQDCRSGSARGA
jgi:hypothetical protein